MFTMTKQEFEQKYNVKLINKNESLLMRVASFLLKPFTPNFMTHFFNTYRLPFQKFGTIAYPGHLDPMMFMDVLEHELMHVEQQKTTCGLIKSVFLVSLFPLPFLFSGRWFIEREPYLNDIRKGRREVEQVIHLLWNYYGWVWPKSLMRKWFEEKLKTK